MCFLWARNSAAPAGCDRVACRGSNLCSQAETVTEILGGVECARACARVSSCSELIKRARVSDQLICHGYSERGQRRRGLWRLWRAVTFSVRVEGLSLRTLCGAQLRWCAESGEVQRGAARVSPDIQRHNQRSNWKRGIRVVMGIAGFRPAVCFIYSGEHSDVGAESKSNMRTAEQRI